MQTTPTNATAPPIASHFGIPSPRIQPAPSAIRIGPVLTTMAVVPASSVRSAMLSTTLYAPNQASPKAVTCSHSCRVGRTQRLPIMVRLRSTEPTIRRPSASAPPLKYAAAPRKTTKALAQASTVTMIAPVTSDDTRCGCAVDVAGMAVIPSR
jgi:hypothetical protein